MKEKKQHTIRTGKYAIIPNFWYFYKEMCRLDKRNIIVLAGLPLSGIGIKYLSAYIPGMMVRLVTEQISPERLFLVILAVTMGMGLLEWAERSCSFKVNNNSLRFKHYMQEKILTKLCRTAYSDLEDPEYKKKVDRSRELYEHWGRDAQACVFSMSEFLKNVITCFSFTVILSMVHPVIVIALIIGNLVQYVSSQRIVQWQETHRSFWQPIELKIEYIAKRIQDFSCAKEMRLYQGTDWLLPKYERLMKERMRWKGKSLRQEQQMQLIASAVNLAVQSAVYFFLIRDVIKGSIKGDDFVWYTAMVLGLNSTLNRIIQKIKDLKEQTISIGDYRQMLLMPDSDYRGECIAKVTDAPEIMFSGVSFVYPGAKQPALNQVDFTIRPGEKIAVVGLNGAGKTTLIKLLSGMYEPTCGEIRIAGMPVRPFSLHSYYKLFSVVFQDLDVMPATILENVAASEEKDADREKVKRCLEQAGLWKLVESLPKGMDTCLKKEMFKDGVNLSGGETQKLLLARAIYKEAPVLILDEPTAALDAVAENQLYLKYNELTRNRTSVFISHRLSSTQFCDRIFMMKNGMIIESGSHQELMRKKGEYYRLFQVQSHYYQKDRTERFESALNPDWEVNGYVSE